MQNKFVYSCSIKIHALGQQTLGKHFLPLAGCGSIFPAKKVVKMLEEVVVSWREVR